MEDSGFDSGDRIANFMVSDAIFRNLLKIFRFVLIDWLNSLIENVYQNNIEFLFNMIIDK